MKTDVFALAENSKKVSSRIASNLGITLDANRIHKQTFMLATKYNHGKGNKVSLRRPSPRLSKKRLGEFLVSARLNALLED